MINQNQYKPTVKYLLLSTHITAAVRHWISCL